MSAGVAAERLRLLIVDDHAVVHWGFRLLLGQQPWVERTFSAATGEEALALARRHRPHVALVDLFTGSSSGAEICEGLRHAAPGIRVLLISGAGAISAQAARAAGASGFLTKDQDAAEVIRAVRIVAAGGEVFAAPPEPGNGLQLSAREREVLEGIAGGATNRQIAAELYLSPHTIKEHTSVLYRKLGVRNRAQAVQKAQQLGLL
jgi:two-component system response regulator DesR